MSTLPTRHPSWDQLFEIAAAQEGLFTTQQAAAAGYSPQLLIHHLHTGRFLRLRRGVYRLVHFPPGEHEDLTAVWLWSEQAGVFSHQTSLALHDLSDLLPSQLHLTLPVAWSKRRLRVPEGVVLYYGDIGAYQRCWVGPVPVTTPLRSIIDCAAAHLPPDQLSAAIRDALSRGLVSPNDLTFLSPALAPFGMTWND